ncbi:MAG: peptidoglycan DD-metalloendopeptidase family protein [Leptolyngbya sp. UWPOB_LEPTO1]|uniref:M23 family metallopeptidase n=1 Tax=Leptolyngbya sp. UWPOB_LEPTO1 TaxID=2815653 RepID=UPI001ACD7376|nr:peptidoglycan DD-metalloendopeptidase family protein [Leptolyngbya sp. UWPOB_LEPTO1]MBN8562802.1 peptidoglycan DD-metalloendopeptidase family protein [Leptolyngbya sp. UWPOB_LEPTO1]
MKLNRPKRILAKSLILSLLSLVLIVTFDWQGASIAAQPAELIASDRTGQINVRTRPSTSATLAGFAVAGDGIQILDQIQGRDGYTWYRMQSNRSGIEGWVRGDLVRILAASSQPRANLSRTAPLPSPTQSANCAPVYPVPIPVINQGFGQVPDSFNLGQTRLHTGVDFDGRIGDPINSPVCGVVFYVGREQDETSYEWGYGWHIKIRDQQGQIHLLAHISKAYVKPGQTVNPGQRIADIGNNGNSTGPHLHYEIRQGADDHTYAVDPMPFLDRATSMTDSEHQSMRSPLRF